jgi:hypothetical protein
VKEMFTAFTEQTSKLGLEINGKKRLNLWQYQEDHFKKIYR